MTTSYPLAGLATVRGTRAEATALELGAALALERAAEAAVAAAVRAHGASVTAARAATLIDDAPQPAWAVARRAAYALRLRRDVDRARTALTARRAELTRAQALVAQARAHATEARGEREVVDRHRERWTDEQRRVRERRED